MLLFCVIILVVTVLDQLKFIMDHKAGFALACKYFALQLPYLVLQITPWRAFSPCSSPWVPEQRERTHRDACRGVDIFKVALPLLGAGFASASSAWS
jgi:hypothetical protein